jgi:ketosteroid isomerase-like protein
VPQGTLRSGYEALGRGDAAPLLDLLGDDFEWVEPELPGYPLAGVHRGAEGFATGMLAPLAELLDGLVFELAEVLEVGDRCVVTGVMRGNPAGAGGAAWELPFAHVWELRDGGVPVRAVGYFDRSRLTLAADRRQLADVADELLDQAAEIRGQWNRLGDALRAAGVEVGDDAGEVAADEGDDDADLAGTPGVASARLVAVDMAQEGASREEVDVYLRDELGVEDTEAILDEAFDPDAGEALGDLPPGGRPGALDPSRLSRLFVRNRG